MSYGLLFIISFIIYKLYKYLQHDLGPRYRIPLDKIDEITPEEGGFRLTFRNRDNMADSVFLRNVKAEIFFETVRSAIEQKLLNTKV